MAGTLQVMLWLLFHHGVVSFKNLILFSFFFYLFMYFFTYGLFMVRDKVEEVPF